jgi:S1-C subfamily serine protease
MQPPREEPPRMNHRSTATQHLPHAASSVRAVLARRAARPAGAVLVVLALAGCGLVRESQARSAPAPVTAPALQANASVQAAAAGDIPALVRKVEPSVVTISHDQGTGSGVIWSKDGVVVTNAHVVGQVEQVEVAFFDGRRADGRVRATDPDTDLAVVEVERSDLQPATFQKELPDIGELAVAMGSPLGFQNTVTAGIISGLHREIPGSAQQGIRSLVDLIQTDAAISPGNSGGALVNAEGQVVGINVAYIPPVAGAVAIGFAIPGATTVDVVGQLLRNGRATHSYLGITPGQVTQEIAAQLGLDEARGVLVRDVVEGSPAAEARLQPGDVIVGIDEARIETVEDLFGELRQRRPGTQARLTIIRDGQSQEVTVTLADRP